MPMTWNAETDAKLMSAIIQVHVPPTSGQLQKIADLMGPECTMKAVSHRIRRYRSMGGSLNMEGYDTGAKVTKTKTNGVVKTPGAGKKRAVAWKKKKSLNEMTPEPEDEQPDDDDEDEHQKGGAGGLLSPPTTTGKKRPANGKIKKEPEVLEDGQDISVGEDVGEGFRAPSDDALL